MTVTDRKTGKPGSGGETDTERQTRTEPERRTDETNIGGGTEKMKKQPGDLHAPPVTIRAMKLVLFLDIYDAVRETQTEAGREREGEREGEAR